MIVGRDEVHALDAHAGVAEGGGLEAAVFVAGGKDKLGVVLVDGGRALDAQGSGERDGVVGAAVLLDADDEVAERRANAGAARVDGEGELLVAAVVVDVGAAGDCASDVGSLLGDDETALQERPVGAVGLVPYPEQVVA